jgi:hypothetical protein
LKGLFWGCLLAAGAWAAVGLTIIVIVAFFGITWSM